MFWTFVITIASAKSAKHGLISDDTGEMYVITMMLMLLGFAAVQIGTRFYDEFGPFWKNWKGWDT